MAVTSQTVGIISIATNIYIDYWADLVWSLNAHVDDRQSLTIYVFTDNVSRAIDLARKCQDLKIIVIEIPPLRWPEATLHRYRIIAQNSELFKEDTLMYLDADMLVNSNISVREIAERSGNGMCFVAHPGFYRPKGKASFALYVSKPLLLKADIRERLANGGLGAWETSNKSSAYVEKSARGQYVCGGVWFGSRKAFVNMCEVLDSRVAVDESAGVMATWHDESHLNWFFSNSQSEIIDPRYCFNSSYPWLRGIRGLIMAVDKEERTRD